jgi:hypothetical protein
LYENGSIPYFQFEVSLLSETLQDVPLTIKELTASHQDILLNFDSNGELTDLTTDNFT